MAGLAVRRSLRLGAPPKDGISAKDAAPYGWAPFVVLFTVGLVDRVEHSLLSGALPLIQAEWGFSDVVAGSIPTAAAVASAIVAIPAGYLTDRLNRTRIITVVVFLWALATLGSGLAIGIAMFYAMRVFLAAAEQIDNPAAGSLLADYYPPATRAKVFGWTRVTAYLGGIGTLLAGVLGELFGWRAVFLIMAVPGVLTALICWRLREPARGLLDAIVARGTTERVPVPESAGAGDEVRPLVPPHFLRQVRRVLTIPSLVLLSVGLMLGAAGLMGIFFWLPSMIVRTFSVGTGTGGSITGAITVVGVILGTYIGARLDRGMHGRVPGARALIGGIGTVAGALLLAAALSMESLGLFSVLLFVEVTLSAMAIPTITAAVADVVDAHTRGLGFALLHFQITVGLAIGPMVVGYVSDVSGSLLTAFYVLIVPMVIAGLFMLACRWTFERDAARVLDEARESF